MLISVDRIVSDKETTISLVMPDRRFCVFGLEDQFREGPKVKGETRIDAGTYRMALRTVGGKHAKYASRFSWHEGMLWVLGVPNFQYILHHLGNDDDDTEGCLCVGLGADAHAMTIQKSVLGYEKYYKAVLPYAKAGDLWVRYRDLDNPMNSFWG